MFGCALLTAVVCLNGHRDEPAGNAKNNSEDTLMTRRAVIFHGTGGHPDYCWYGWLGARLAARGYHVELPHYPDINSEPISTFLPKVLSHHVFDDDTVLVGHSGGAPLILSILQNVETTIPQALLVAGYTTEPNTEDEPVLQAGYDWARIKSHVRDLYFINSVGDPYGCDDEQGRTMFDRLGGTLIIRDDGHFETPTFELLDRLID